ncbi:MAG: substrate-binding domain-containing protein [Negativicutes bacterium]|jgi:ribose transport system substrate-binding protein
MDNKWWKVAIAVSAALIIVGAIYFAIDNRFLLGNIPSGQEAPKKIALVLRSTDNPSFIEMERTARISELALGVNIIVRKLSQEVDSSEQIAILHDLANQDIDALVIDPVDSMALLPVIKQYQAAGIPVVNVGCRLDPASMIQFNMSVPPFVCIDNESAAYDAAKFVSDRITKPTNVVLFMGINSSILSDTRKRGALRAFSENPYCALKLTKIVYWSKNQATFTAKTLYNDYASIGCFFCVDDVVAIGVAEYLEQTNRRDVMVVGFGDLKAAETYIEKGYMTLTVAERSGKQISTAIKYAVDLLDGKKVPQATYIDYSLVDDKMLKER